MNMRIQVTPQGGGPIMETSLEEFMTSPYGKTLDAFEAARLGSMAVGDVIELGGGAFPALTVRRVA